MSKNKIIIMRKNIHGSLSFKLENFNDMSQIRELHFNDRRPTQRVAIDFALSIFIDPVLFSMYKKGMFIVENEQEFYLLAEEAGVYYNFEKNKKEQLVVQDMEYVPEAEILESLKSRNAVGLRTKLEEASNYLKSQYLFVAASNIKELSTGNVQIIEDVLKTVLPKDNSEE